MRLLSTCIYLYPLFIFFSLRLFHCTRYHAPACSIPRRHTDRGALTVERDEILTFLFFPFPFPFTPYSYFVSNCLTLNLEVSADNPLFSFLFSGFLLRTLLLFFIVSFIDRSFHLLLCSFLLVRLSPSGDPFFSFFFFSFLSLLIFFPFRVRSYPPLFSFLVPMEFLFPVPNVL